MRGYVAGGNLRGVELEMVGCGEGDVGARDGWGGWVKREIASGGKMVRLVLRVEEMLLAAFVDTRKSFSVRVQKRWFEGVVEALPMRRKWKKKCS